MRTLGFPLLFVQNHGRYGDRLQFHVEHDGGAILISDSGITFRDRGQDDLMLEFPGSCRDCRVLGEKRSPTRFHYLVGKEEAWRTDVPTFERLRYADLWPGIDLVLEGDRGSIKYAFHVAPGADPGRIRMRYVGGRLEMNASGDLLVRTGDSLRRTDPAPVAFQETPNGKVSVRAGFKLETGAPDLVGFTVGSYDESKSLVIDPAFLAYSGYLVPNMNNVYDIAVDANGAALVAGVYFRDPWDSDACVARIRPDGTAFDFVTILASNPPAWDGAGGIAVDSTGIYIAGGTYADQTAFPVKGGPDLTYNGGGDIFVCKLAHDGKTIIYCGYIGGKANDGVRNGVAAIDSAGALWIAGSTWSSDYPVLGGPQLTMPGPLPACVTKVAPDGKSLVLSGYLGGSSPWHHWCMGVAVDTSGDGYVTGVTTSDAKTYGFPVKGGPSTTYGGGSADTFIAKINGQTGGLVYCGFIGGWDYEYPWGIAVDAQGAAYVTGGTFSDHTKTPTFPVVNWPITTTTYGYSYANRGDGFISKVNPRGNGFVYSGYLGGAGAQGIAVDSQQRCYLGGASSSHTTIPIGSALSPVNNGPTGTLDGFVMRVAANGQQFDYAGFYGGAGTDCITSVALGPRDTVFVTGVTLGSTGSLPLKLGPNFTFNAPPPWGRNTGSLYGTFVAKIAEASITPSGSGRIGTTIAFTLFANDDPGLPYLAGTALGSGPVPLGSRSLRLTPDPLLQLSTSGQVPGTFQGYTGKIGPNGTATANLHIPNAPSLVGVQLHTAFLTFDAIHPLGIKSISNTAVFRIQ